MPKATAQALEARPDRVVASPRARRARRAGAALWAPLINLRPGDDASLQMQIRRSIVAAILDGAVPEGSRLPSSRQLARSLGVARNTVTQAYREMAEERWIGARPRSGYVVLPARHPRPEAPPPPAEPPGRSPAWSARLQSRHAAQRNIHKPPGWFSFPYPFVYGQPDPALFPVSQWRECSRAALAVLAIRDWSADLIDGDDAMLIDQIRRRVLPRRGIFASPDQIMITVGTQNALYLLAQLLTSPASVVGVEDPGYPDARNILATRGATIRPLALPVTAAGARGCDLLYLTPSHQCPTSSTMPMPDRQALLDAAIRDDQLIVEDDYESELAVQETPTPALKSLDRSDRVIYLGSLSKCLAPGLRLGYLVGARPLITEGRALRRLMLRHPPANNQRAAAMFIALGHYDTLLDRLAAATRERAALLTESLARHLPGFRFAPPRGGSSLWVAGPHGSNRAGSNDAGFDAADFATRAERAGVLIERGDVFFATPPAPCPFFRLGFSSIRVERIAEGVRQLARLLPGAA